MAKITPNLPRFAVPHFFRVCFSGWACGFALFVTAQVPYRVEGNSNVHVTRFWHNHQPIYWPEWNSGTGQDLRSQYAHDSMRLKPNQNYGAPWNHPHNDLEQIFGLQDRLAAYQGRPRNALTQIANEGGFAMSYSGSLIDNIRNLAANGWNYSSNWNAGNTEASGWTTPRGARRMDLVGFSYHHSLNPLLPKAVLRKEIQIFKEAWWKAWGGNPDKSDHSRGYFPTEMAYSREIIDVLADEGYEWVIVASHHLSRTSPSYNNFVNPNQFQIKSSPPNRADQLGPVIDNPAQWWFAEPNPGQAAWNVSPFAYQLHRVEYVDPETGSKKSLIAVPSDDVLSYQAGYSGAQIGVVDSAIAPHAADPNRPVLIMPATDGDNAWGGGFDSWEVSTPQFFGAAQSRGYRITTIQDFVDQFGGYAPVAHIEAGAWIYPEMCYGSPYFLKWIEPPVRSQVTSPTTYPGTIIDVENGWSLKFFAYAPKMAGANWVETAEQIWRDEGGSVEPWRIQAPYDWDGTWTSPNVVELAWHIYLKGLDSGFQYYGGLGNDDETKPGLAARRAMETLDGYLRSRLAADRTGPTVLMPQRFPYNPGGYTFGWFNSIPGGDTNFLKKNPSEFYVWTLVHDVSGVASVDLMLRRDKDGVRSLSNTDNETYAGGADVEDWVRIPMVRRILPNNRSELNAIAGHGEIDFVVTAPEIADQYFVKIDDTVFPGFRDNLFDYYIEAVDLQGNLRRSDIQHVYVEEDGPIIDPPATPGGFTALALSSSLVRLQWEPVSGATGYRIYRDAVEVATAAAGAGTYEDAGLEGGTAFSYSVVAFNPYGNSPATGTITVTTPEAPEAPALPPASVVAEVLSPSAVRLSWSEVEGATLYHIRSEGTSISMTAGKEYVHTGLAAGTIYRYTVAAGNEGGFSAPSAVVAARTPDAAPSFDLGSAEDPFGYLLENAGMRIFAAVRGTLLYVATWTPSGGENDHFILVADSLHATAAEAAPWAKAGLTAHPRGQPYLAGESENSYAAWFDAGESAQVWRSPTGGGRLEGVIDLVEAFGRVPDTLHLAALAYQTADGGALVAQSPSGDGDGDVDPGEFLTIETHLLRDSGATGMPDTLDPRRGFRAVLHRESGQLRLLVPMLPGRTYHLESSVDLVEWHVVEGSELVPVEGAMHEFMLPEGGGLSRFYRVAW